MILRLTFFKCPGLEVGEATAIQTFECKVALSSTIPLRLKLDWRPMAGSSNVYIRVELAAFTLTHMHELARKMRPYHAPLT